MSRREILADLLAELELERFTPTPEAPPFDPVTEAEAAWHRQVLAEALGGDLYAIEHQERSAS